MSVAKIKYYEASDIGNRIADKAFAHLVTPLEDKLNIFLKGRYDALVRDVIGGDRIAELVKAGVLLDNGGAFLKFVGQKEDFTEYLKGDLVVSPAGYSNAFIIDDEVAFEAYVTLVTPLRALRHKRALLVDELKSQCEGKSAKAVMKAWPEAAQIVADFFHITVDGKDTSMTSPLEQLLAKFMPMLPAPTPQGA
jgi:hypothetical protein